MEKKGIQRYAEIEGGSRREKGHGDTQRRKEIHEEKRGHGDTQRRKEMHGEGRNTEILREKRRFTEKKGHGD